MRVSGAINVVCSAISEKTVRNMSRTTQWRVDVALQSALKRVGIHDTESFLALANDDAPGSYTTTVDLDIEQTSRRFYLKCYRYPGWKTSRGLIGRGSLYGSAPCIREFDNLHWLRMNGIQAVRPIMAVAKITSRRLVAHALLTEWVEGAPDLAARARNPEDALLTSSWKRAQTVRALGASVGAMHRLGFVHRDLHARNILVQEGDAASAVWFLDCRRGGMSSGLRGKNERFDIRTLATDLRVTLRPLELRRLTRAYLRARCGKPVESRELERWIDENALRNTCSRSQ